jgi:UDPglucose 6-dehydrogenase
MRIKIMRIGVVGCGNVGLSTLRVSAEHGHDVLGYDLNSDVRSDVCKHLGYSALATSLADLAACEVIFLCVPTDSKPTGECDLSIYETVVLELAAVFRGRTEQRPLVAQRSTCLPGTARKMSQLVNVCYAVCPSFLTKRTVMEDARDPPRIAYAGNARAQKILGEYFRTYDQTRLFRSDKFETVELLKYIENAIDGVLISLWNEFFSYALGSGIAVEDFVNLMDHLGDRPRFASSFRVPGGAFGKWCLPKDLVALTFDATTRELPRNVLEGALQTNASILQRRGENPHAFYELLEERGGRLHLTQNARDWLAQAAGASTPQAGMASHKEFSYE